MAKILRWAGYLIGVLLVLVVVAMAYVWIGSSAKLNASVEAKAAKLSKPTPAQLADGSRQLHVLGCRTCHGDGLQGKVFLDEPGVGKVFAPNLTLVAAKATDGQLDHAIRQGIGHDGRPLLIMPSEGYQFLTDAESAALIAAIRALPRGGKEQPKAQIGPMGRLGIALGKFSTGPELVETFRKNQIPDLGRQFAAGRHLVATNCAECHGPQLHGQEVEPGVVSPDLEIAGAYDLDQFRKMLRTGVGPGGKDLGLMGRIARNDFKYLTDQEISDIHAYLAERARRMP
jgi:mono/diheme cytochrome c family protein